MKNINNNHFITIVTPTYNRAKYLPKLYNSLLRQTNGKFQWLIIDDGSTDNTKSIISQIAAQDKRIEYYQKTNGGKHTAINYSVQHIRGDYVLIVDSDDQLMEDAIDIIYRTIEKYEDYDDIAYISFQRSDDGKTPLVKNMPNKETISDHITYRINKKRYGDCSEVIKTQILREFPFPEYMNEKFLSEGYLWANIAKKYKAVYINKIIYICKYLDGGLTRSGRRMRINNPIGGIETAKAYLDNKKRPRLNTYNTIKYTMLYLVYSRFANKKFKEIILHSNRKLHAIIFYPISIAIYNRWRKTYEKKSLI